MLFPRLPHDEGAQLCLSPRYPAALCIHTGLVLFIKVLMWMGNKFQGFHEIKTLPLAGKTQKGVEIYHPAGLKTRKQESTWTGLRGL